MTTQQRVHDLLCRHAYSADCIAAALSISPNAAWIALRNLRHRGAVELVRVEGRHRVYRAVGALTDTKPRKRDTAAYGSEACELARVWR